MFSGLMTGTQTNRMYTTQSKLGSFDGCIAHMVVDEPRVFTRTAQNNTISFPEPGSLPRN